MSTTSQNVFLKEGFLSPDRYNRLSHVDEVPLDDKREAAKEHLLQLILDYGVDRLFSVHLLHKHYDIPQGKIMVYETIRSPSDSVFRIFCARPIDNSKQSLRGKFFMAEPDGTLQAYEYTVDGVQDVSQHQDFIREISHEIVRLGMEKVFAVTVLGTESYEPFFEFELPSLEATVSFPLSSWLPRPTNVETDWHWITRVLDSQGVPVRELSSSGSGGHCSNQAGTHTAAGFDEPPTDSRSIESLPLGALNLASDTEGFDVLRYAMKRITVQ